MTKTEVISGSWKFIKSDPLNWQVHELAEIKSGDRKGEVDWVRLPNYFGTLKAAVMFAKERNRERKLETAQLDDAVKQIEKLDKAFIGALEKALKEAG